MRKLLLVGFLLVAGGAIAFQGLSDRVRPAGVNTPSTSRYAITVDSSDTFEVDTSYSDTIDIGDYKYVTIQAGMDGFSLADSCNDSVVTEIVAFASYNSQWPIAIWTDTIPNTLGTLDSTIEIVAAIRVDTLAVNKLWFRTIIEDSVITTVSDSFTLTLNYRLGQTGTR